MKTVFVKDVNKLTSGESISLMGWAQEIRVMKNIGFIILRDSSGLIQATFRKENKHFADLTNITRESVVSITGKIPEKVMSKLGMEIVVDSMEILNRAEVPLPVGIVDEVEVDFDTRFNNRFMDLRKPEHHRMAGEFGHMVIDPLGPVCGCGRRGCFEIMAGGKGTLRIAEAMNTYAKSPYLKKIPPEKLEARHVFDGAEAGDKECIRVIDKVVENMTRGVANLVNIFDPEAIMIGGGLSNSKELVVDGIAERLQEELKTMKRNVEIFRTNQITVELSPLAVVLYEKEMPSFNYERIIREMRQKIAEKTK